MARDVVIALANAPEPAAVPVLPLPVLKRHADSFAHMNGATAKSWVQGRADLYRARGWDREDAMRTACLDWEAARRTGGDVAALVRRLVDLSALDWTEG